jgi:hypothetical protein
VRTSQATATESTTSGMLLPIPKTVAAVAATGTCSKQLTFIVHLRSTLRAIERGAVDQTESCWHLPWWCLWHNQRPQQTVWTYCKMNHDVPPIHAIAIAKVTGYHLAQAGLRQSGMLM